MRIGITMGDPNGIGPEIVARFWAEKKYRDCVVYGNAAALSAYARLSAEIIDPYGRLPEHSRGRVSAVCGAAAYAYLEAAARDALAGRIDALVTAPLHKTALNLAGYKYAGHTEILAKLTGAKKFGMFFYSPALCLMLATVHQSIRQVPALLTRQRLRDTVELALLGLRLIGLPEPRLAVCGLNPHAGEDGLLGLEEKKIITPVVRGFRRAGLNISGPFPADTLFLPEQRRRYDLIIAHYHDQGLIPLKMLAFDRAVNVTVGLPLIRTSVDHGTAYDIAGRGIARTGSLAAAVRLARKMVKNRAG
ncbi:MAG: 4-hydroxythreonine-4-phosphate dehydrogenase PdxA [Candidatus Margulisbacteria bacterium]|jgi:4-hydroxythreonine-4-phosphate dehydrogenase|nr:4-hydroxythreonine-4-phosphate dehydrogenase PdxA [Candidatus Margulisiibacteriota bacterium]